MPGLRADERPEPDVKAMKTIGYVQPFVGFQAGADQAAKKPPEAHSHVASR
jgi:hypothetical protein